MADEIIDPKKNEIPFHKGIRFKVILGIVSILIFTLIPFGFFQIQDQEKLLMTALKNQSMTVVKSVASNSAAPLENFDDLSLQNLVFKAEEDKEVAFINVVNPDNEQVVEGDYVKDGKTIDKKKKIVANNVLFLSAKILKAAEEGEEPEVLGTVEGGFYTDAVIQEITNKKILFSVGLLGISFIIVVVMYLFLSKEYVSPVLKLSTAASQLENENLEIVTDKSDELGNLGQIFKDMRTTVNNQKIILEKQVAERTVELNREKDNVTKLLNNMSQAVFKVNKKKEILGPISAYAKELFGDDLVGRDIFEVLYGSIDKGSVLFAQMKSAYSVLFGGDVIQWFASDGLLPEKLDLMLGENKKILKAAHEPIYDEEDLVEFILYVIEDITEKVVAEEKLAKKNEQLKIVQEELSFSSRKELAVILRDFLDLTIKGISSLVKLKDESKNIDYLRELFRCLHTIKGSSAGLVSIASEVHSTEEMVSSVVKGEQELDESAWSKINRDVHEVHGMIIKYIKVAVHELNMSVNVGDGLFEMLKNIGNQVDNVISGFKNELENVADFRGKLASISDTFLALDDLVLSKDVEEIAEKVKTNHEEGSLYTETIRHDIYERLVVARGKISTLDTNLSKLKEGKGGEEEQVVPIENINCLKNEILKLAQNKDLSLDSVEKAFGKVDDGESVYKLIKSFEKVVSETCDKLGKKVTMGVDGNDLLVGPDTAKCLRESLIHIVRNSVDHGIEKPQDRVNLGKNEVGSLKISFRNGNGELVLDVEDDGGGIDAERLFGKALSSGAGKDAEMSEEEKLDLLFLPSISTKEEVTDVSGRGVGMDAVRSGLNELGGEITVRSKLREGTTFTIKIPNK